MTTPGTSTEPGTTKPGTTKPGTTKTGTTILEYDQAWNDHWSTLEMDQAVKCSGPNTWPFPGYVAFFQAWSFLAWSFQAWSCTVSQCTAFKGTVPRSHKHWRELPTFATLFFERTATSRWFIFRGSGGSRNGCANLAYRSRHRRPVVAKSAGSGDPVFTSMNSLL
jgi:hypothetical protein